jgi:hypothetical protein
LYWVLYYVESTAPVLRLGKMGGRGQGVQRDRGGVRGRVSSRRYDRVRAGSGAGAEWSNRWQVLNQTGNDVEMDLNEEVMVQRDGGRMEGRDSNVTERPRVRQPGTGSVESGGRERDENSREIGRETGRETGREEEDRRENGGGTIRKRNLEERSPGQHDDIRTNRPRLDEFDVGSLCEEIDRKMRIGIIDSAPEDFREKLREGLETLLEGMKGVMNGTSDCVAEERRSREAEGMRVEERLERMEERMNDMKRPAENIADEQVHDNIRRAEVEMEKKVRHAGKCLKLLDVDFGKATEDRLWMVRSIIRWMKDDVHQNDVSAFERVIRRTRVQILGKGTVPARGNGGKTIYTVPVLLECQSKGDAVELEGILKGAGYFSSFHWPPEIMEFVRGAREEIKKLVTEKARISSGSDQRKETGRCKLGRMSRKKTEGSGK